MLKELVKLANHLDSKGLVKEADYLDRIIKSAEEEIMNKVMPPSIGVNTEGKTSIISHRMGEDRCIVWLDIEKHSRKEGKDRFCGTVYWGPGRNHGLSEIHDKESFVDITSEKLKSTIDGVFKKCNQKVISPNDQPKAHETIENYYSKITDGSKSTENIGNKSVILQVPGDDHDDNMSRAYTAAASALGTFTGN